MNTGEQSESCNSSLSTGNHFLNACLINTVFRMLPLRECLMPRATRTRIRVRWASLMSMLDRLDICRRRGAGSQAKVRVLAVYWQCGGLHARF